jgi:hypothetical protein
MRMDEPFAEGVRFIRMSEDDVDALIDLGAVPPNWIGWHQARILKNEVQAPAISLNGQRVVIVLPNDYIFGFCEAPSVSEFVSKKIKDYPPSEDNTYRWA